MKVEIGPSQVVAIPVQSMGGGEYNLVTNLKVEPDIEDGGLWGLGKLWYMFYPIAIVRH